MTVLLLTVLTVPASAQEGATLPPGPSHFTEPLEIRAGETLTIGPGTRISGTAFVNVSGTLRVAGTATSLAEFSLPVRVQPGGQAHFSHARFAAINATALEVLGGEARLNDTRFVGNTWGIRANGSGRVIAGDVSLSNQSGEALSVSESGDVRIERAVLVDNGRGVTVYSARAFHLADSTFARNGQHLVVDLGPWSAPGQDVLLARNLFGPPAATPAQLPSIVLRHDAPLVDAGEEQLVRMESNRILGAAVGVRIEGRGLVVESTNDTFLDNTVGLSVQQSTVHLVRPTFGNDFDVEGSGRVTLEDATYLRTRGLPLATPPPDASWLPWAVGGGALLLAGLVAVVALRLRRAPTPAPAPPPPPAPVVSAPPAPAPAPELSTALSAVERRILEDILEHPGTAQRAVADRLGYTRQALHYHVKKLEARGLVTKRIEGRETRCEVPAAVASLLATRTRTQEKA